MDVDDDDVEQQQHNHTNTINSNTQSSVVADRVGSNKAAESTEVKEGDTISEEDRGLGDSFNELDPMVTAAILTQVMSSSGLSGEL